MQDKIAVEVENLSVFYANGTQALKSASFALRSGTITALVGVNGSGKSTLFKAIMGFVGADSGKVTLFGELPKKAMARNLVAYVPQSEEVDWNFPVLVRDVVMMGRYGQMNWLRWPSRKDHEQVASALGRVGMESFATRQIGELSGGQKKRVFLARAMAQNAEIILLDEPFTGIDVKSEQAIIGLLWELQREGKVILISTHNLGSVPEFCDQTILINQEILAFGPTVEVFTQANLEKAFGGLLRRFTLTGNELHDDEDQRSLTVLTDDERPFVIYDAPGGEEDTPKGEDP